MCDVCSLRSRGVRALEILGGRSTTAPHAPAARDYKAWHGMRPRCVAAETVGLGASPLLFRGPPRRPGLRDRQPRCPGWPCPAFSDGGDVVAGSRAPRNSDEKNEIIKTSCCPCTLFCRSGSRQHPFWAWVLYFQRPPWHHLTVPCFIS